MLEQRLHEIESSRQQIATKLALSVSQPYVADMMDRYPTEYLLSDNSVSTGITQTEYPYTNLPVSGFAPDGMMVPSGLPGLHVSTHQGPYPDGDHAYYSAASDSEQQMETLQQYRNELLLSQQKHEEAYTTARAELERRARELIAMYNVEQSEGSQVSDALSYQPIDSSSDNVTALSPGVALFTEQSLPSLEPLQDVSNTTDSQVGTSILLLCKFTKAPR